MGIGAPHDEPADEAASEPIEELDGPGGAPAGAPPAEPAPEDDPAADGAVPDASAAAAAYAAAQQQMPPRPTPPAPQPDAATDAGEPAEPDGEPAGAETDDPLAAKAARADEYLQMAQRTQADFENYRKRAVREQAIAQERGIIKLAKELLPAIDNLDRALAATAEADGLYAEGIKLVHADLMAALGRAGIEPFSPRGELFDPQLHEAVAHQPIEGAAPGTVAEVFQLGYRLGATVLRPARVLVAA